MSQYGWLSSLDDSSTGDEVVNQHNYGNHEHQVNQPAANMQGESQEPKDEQHNKDSPKHFRLQAPHSRAAPGE